MKAGEDGGLALFFAEVLSMLAPRLSDRSVFPCAVGLSCICSDFVLLEVMQIFLILPEDGDPWTVPNDSLNRHDKPTISESDFKVETE